MRHYLLASFLLVFSTTGFAAAQTNSPPASSTEAKPSPSLVKRVDLTGCVQGVDGGLDHYVLLNGKDKKTYQLSGKDLRAYVGRHVRVEGGLYPSANVSAQAGAIDPAQAAVATLTGSAAPGADRVEFRVQRVRRLTGSCPQP